MARHGEKDSAREDRIIMQIVVDAYGPDERAMGWYCYLAGNLAFPFTARCTARRAISPLKPKDKGRVIAVADGDECLREMFVTVRWEDDVLAVPLSQLRAVDGDEQTREAAEDWRYWVSRGYQ